MIPDRLQCIGETQPDGNELEMFFFFGGTFSLSQTIPLYSIIITFCQRSIGHIGPPADGAIQ